MNASGDIVSLLDSGKDFKATPSNERLGRELFEAGEVEFLARDGSGITARVGGGTKRTVEFERNGETLSWRCNCRKAQTHFCKHAVAVAFALRATEGESRELGRTKESGFEMGVRRTYDITPEEVWKLLVSARGNELITGRKEVLEGDGPGASWNDGKGTAYEVTTFSPLSHLRMRFRLASSPKSSILQIRVLRASGRRATISIHQEGLADSDARAKMLGRWKAVHERIARIVAERNEGKDAQAGQ